MRPLRIGYIVGTLLPGGAERQMMALARALPRDRFAAELIEFSGPGSYVMQVTNAGVPVRTLGSPPAQSGLTAQLVRRSQKTVAYLRHVRAAQYDIIDAWLYPSYILAALLRQLSGTPIVVAGRRNLGDLRDRSRPLERVVDVLARRMTDAVVANSQAVAEYALQRGGVDPAKLRVIRNGVELIGSISATDRLAQRKMWGMTDDDIVIGCVANLREVKDHPVLLEAFRGLAASDPRPRLVLVGDGPMRADLERRIVQSGIADRVHLQGSVLDPRPLYGSFDLVVQASRSEGLPNAVLEAAASGLPVVATAVGGTDEIVVAGTTGLLVAPGDVAALMRALQRMAGDVELRMRLGRAGRERVATMFGMDRFVAEFVELYEELATAQQLDG